MKNFAITFLSVMVLAACNNAAVVDDQAGHHHTEEITLTPEQMKLAGIELGMIEERPIMKTITANGMVDVPPESLADISAPLGGFVRKAPHYDGAFVKKGALLVALEHPEYIRIQQEYLDAASQFEMVALEYDRQEKLYKSVAAAEKIFEQTRSSYNSIKARKEGLETTLRIAQINPESVLKNGIQQQVVLRAPFDGYITMVAVNLGKQVGPEEVLYQMVDPTHLHLELQVYPRDLQAIKKGQAIKYRVQGSRTWKSGHVVLTGQSVDPTSRTVRIHAHTDAQDADIKPGMFVQAEIAVASANGWSLPSTAFLEEGSKAFVFEKTETGFKKVEVEVLDKGAEYYHIAPLDAKGPFIVKGAYYLVEMEEEGHEH